MSIEWQHFTPWASLAGGLLIGLAATMMILFNGKIAGISGILGGLLTPKRSDIGWRIAFIAGLLLAPLAYGLVASVPDIRLDAQGGTLLAAGLLVGFGTRLGSGCTSGHGVCGLSRMSPRSAAATAAFMAAGFLVVFLVRHVLA